jgi:hypothetical protein
MEENNFFAEFGKAFIPKKARPHIRHYVMKAGYNEVPYTFFGIMFYVSLALTYFPFMALIWTNLEKLENPLSQGLLAFFGWAGIQLVVLAIIILGIYFFLDIKIFNRTLKMESLIADYLQLVSTNLRGGMSFEKSLWSAINPQFSVLSNEISLASKKVLTGYDIEVALQEFSDKYDSPILKRTIGLIIGEIKAGGKVADLVDKIIDDLKNTKELKQDMAASVVSYMIFIGAIVVVISPALFALSYNLIMVITNFASRLSSISGSGGSSILPVSLDAGSVDIEGFKNFSIAAIGTIALFSSMIISILEKGSIRGGVKYIPFFIGGSIALYHVFLYMLTMFFGGLVF